MANTITKSELIQRIVDGHPSEIARKDVKRGHRSGGRNRP